MRLCAELKKMQHLRLLSALLLPVLREAPMMTMRMPMRMHVMMAMKKIAMMRMAVVIKRMMEDGVGGGC